MSTSTTTHSQRLALSAPIKRFVLAFVLGMIVVSALRILNLNPVASFSIVLSAFLVINLTVRTMFRRGRKN